MPAGTDPRLADGDHALHPYRRDADLLRVVGAYLVAAAEDDDAAVVIAEPEHRTALEAAVAAAGVDVEAAEADGRLVTLNAADALSRFLVGGSPDPSRFDALIGAIVRDAAANGRRVRAYGEMVTVLWKTGNVAGAIELEKLWNGLGDQVPSALLCAYPMDMDVAPTANGSESYAELCDLHSKVVGGAPHVEGAELARRFAGTPDAPRLARRFVAETLRYWDRHDYVEDGLLLVTELVANAVVHVGSDVTVGLSRRAAGVQLEVSDASGDGLIPTEPCSADGRGHGLSMVGALASRWGHEPVDGGKVVWVELRRETRVRPNREARQ